MFNEAEGAYYVSKMLWSTGWWYKGERGIRILPNCNSLEKAKAEANVEGYSGGEAVDSGTGNIMKDCYRFVSPDGSRTVVITRM